MLPFIDYIITVTSLIPIYIISVAFAKLSHQMKYKRPINSFQIEPERYKTKKKTP